HCPADCGAALGAGVSAGGADCGASRPMLSKQRSRAAASAMVRQRARSLSLNGAAAAGIDPITSAAAMAVERNLVMVNTWHNFGREVSRFEFRRIHDRYPARNRPEPVGRRNPGAICYSLRQGSATRLA